MKPFMNAQSDKRGTQLCMVLRKFRFGSVCNEESLKLFEKGNHTVKAVLSEDNTSSGMTENN